VVVTEVEVFVVANLPRPPARVLEVGAGRGDLARTLRRAGYDVTAIDPDPGGDDVVPVGLAELDVPAASFDAAVAVVSLHHVDSLEQGCLRLAHVLRPGAALLIDEFDIDRLDERAAGWWLEQRRALGREGERTPRAVIDDLRAEVHPLARVLEALTPSFEVGPPLRGSYLYRWDLDESLRPVEEELIARGELPAIGVRLVAARAGEPAGRHRPARRPRP
jgi:SAM-dependent methyltransferase